MHSTMAEEQEIWGRLLNQSISFVPELPVVAASASWSIWNDTVDTNYK